MPVSGGYAYDRRIVAGLREAGHAVRVVELAGTLSAGRRSRARRRPRRLGQHLPDAARPIIDGLALPAFAGMEDVAGGAQAGRPDPPPDRAGDRLQRDRPRGAARASRSACCRGLSRVIVTSETTAERLAADFGVDPERIKVVVPGTDDAPRSLGSGGPTCRIISIGTLVPRKGHDVLLRALARLFDLDWQLTIVGSPERDPVHARTLAALAEELGIARRVRFAGEVTDDALEALWREADMFALATHWEGYGMAVAEALKRGLPVAVTAGGAAGVW